MPVQRTVVHLLPHQHPKRLNDHESIVTSRFFTTSDLADSHVAPPEDSSLPVYYPKTSEDRGNYRTKSGKVNPGVICDLLLRSGPYLP